MPDQNREDGANPVISLSNFLAHLVDNQTLALNGVGRMMQFMAWGWGTTVFGEKQPDLLEAHDQIFEQGNGTTYALTQVQTNPQNVTTRNGYPLRPRPSQRGMGRQDRGAVAGP